MDHEPGAAQRRPSNGQLAFVCVLLVWLGLLVRAHVFIATSAASFPIGDETAIWALAPPFGEMSWGCLWWPMNEHRLPLPRLFLWGLYQSTGDLRCAMYVQLELLAVLALAMLLLARRLRGRASLTDAFFPLIWLHTGNAVNLLSSWQLTNTLPLALVSLSLMLAASSPSLLRNSRALAGVISGLCLPLCGGVGVVQLPAWAAWKVGAGRSGLRSRDPCERRAGWTLLCGLPLLALLFLGYFVGFQHEGHDYSGSPSKVLLMTSAFLALGLGPVAQDWWPVSGVLVGCFLTATIWLIATRLRRDPAERLRAAGLLASIGGILCLALSIAVARGSDSWRQAFADRYVSLSVPLLCSAYYAWTLYGSGNGRRFACAVLALVALAAWPQNERFGQTYGESHHDRAARFEAVVRRGAHATTLVSLYSKTFFVVPGGRARLMLKILAEQGRSPFLGSSAASGAEFDFPDALLDFPAWRTLPLRIESHSPPRDSSVGDEIEQLVEAPSCVHLPLHADERSIRGQFGIPDLVADSRRSCHLRVVIELVAAGTGPVTLLERILDANGVESDRKPQAFELELPAHAAGEILLRTQAVDEAEAGSRWSSWSGVEIR